MSGHLILKLELGRFNRYLLEGIELGQFPHGKKGNIFYLFPPLITCALVPLLVDGYVKLKVTEPHIVYNEEIK